MPHNKNIRVIISGGGTGGHIFPAIAIGKALQKLQPGLELLYVGAEGKMEMEKVPQAGFKIIGLPIAGFQRKLSAKNLSFPFKLMRSLWKAYSVVKDFNPDVAVGVGGYASGPTLQMASWLGVPTVLQEQNSLPGVTNKLLGKKAAKVCVAFEGMDKYFERNKIVLTGNPIRENIVESKMSREEGIEKFGLKNDLPCVFITGGSLGARAVNEGIAEHLDKLIAANIQLIWQVGKVYLPAFKALEEKAPSLIRITDFIPDMDAAYASADIIVSRAGGTISELAIIGKPSILLPSPNVAEDHQTVNVMSLVNKDAAILVRDSEAKVRLVDEILILLGDNKRQGELSHNIKAMARPNAALDIAKEILALVK